MISGLHRFILFTFLISALSVQGQFALHSTNLSFESELVAERYQKDSLRFNSFKPWLKEKSATRQFNVLNRFRNGHLLRKEGDGFNVGASPLLEMIYYRPVGSTDSLTRYTNGRGVLVEVNLENRITMQTWFMENQSFFPGYLDRATRATGAVPGSARTKPFKNSGFDYAVAGGSVTYQPKRESILKYVQAGHDRNFIGHGHRSFFLGDHQMVYPFLKVVTGGKRWRYHNMITVFQDLVRTPKGSAPESIFFRKNGSFNYLSFIPLKGLEIGLFEGILWDVYEQTDRKRLPLNFYFPVIFGNTLLYGLSDNNVNCRVGLEAAATLTDDLVIFTQVMNDEARNTIDGFQFGVKWITLPFLKGLGVRAEYNWYDSSPVGMTNIGSTFDHYGMTLGHALGGRGSEVNAALTWNYKRFRVSTSLAGIMGSNVQASRLLYINGDAHVSYLINPEWNMAAIIGFRARKFSVDPSPGDDRFIYTGITTSLWRKFQDF